MRGDEEPEQAAIPNLTHLPPTPPIEIGVCNKKQAQACSFAPLATGNVLEHVFYGSL